MLNVGCWVIQKRQMVVIKRVKLHLQKLKAAAIVPSKEKEKKESWGPALCYPVQWAVDSKMEC